jgi:hypothetical protein
MLDPSITPVTRNGKPVLVGEEEQDPVALDTDARETNGLLLVGWTQIEIRTDVQQCTLSVLDQINAVLEATVI